jgi:hypothetical protein
MYDPRFVPNVRFDIVRTHLGFLSEYPFVSSGQLCFDQSMTILGLTLYPSSDTLVVERKKEVSEMTTYKIEYRWNGGMTKVVGVVDEEGLEAIRSNGKHVIEVLEPYTPVIRYKVDPTCKRCTTDEYVPHYNCIYGGKAAGHSAAHCTADSCY